MTRAARPATALFGTGRLARAVAPLLVERGWPVVAVVGRRSGAARGLARRLSDPPATTSPARALARAELILLAVPDREIAPLAERLAARPGAAWRDKVVLHHAGTLGLEPLRALERAGAAVGLMHPLQVLARPEMARELLAGSRARIEGARRAGTLARRLARDLGLVPLRFPRALDARGRAAYHAAASLAGNDVLALLDLAADVLGLGGLERQEALEALLPLARGALLQARGSALSAGLAGPVVRGDAETLRAHLRELARVSPGHAELHRRLSTRLLEIALRDGAAPAPARRRALARLLGGGRGGPRRGPTV